MDSQLVYSAIVIGLGATLLTDLWNLCLKLFFGIPSLNFCLLGRWFRHMPGGMFVHKSIAGASSMSFECMVGRTAHYTIGIVLTLAFLCLVRGEWLTTPTLLPALVYGIGTVVFPFFIMQPSFGLGVAGSATTHPAQTRVKSLMTHTVFGVGLWMCAQGVRSV